MLLRRDHYYLESLESNVNPVALRKAKIAYNFGLSECNRVKNHCFQERNVKNLEQEEEEMKDLVRKTHDHALMTAAQKKEAKLLEESMVIFWDQLFKASLL